MYETTPSRDSDGDLLSIQATNSSSSSMSTESNSSTTTSRLSFDLTTGRLESCNISSKPHRSSDASYESITTRGTSPGLRDFRLVRRIGSGEIGTVYLCRLGSGGCYYAMKVVDREAAARKKKKAERSETERKILKMLDHPFLPKLYAEFEAAQFSCVVMEYCSGGDLHSLRHSLPLKRFSLSSARFYAAEVLVALEYLHMLGIIYRDLKPENVLVRSDGHIMLSDFDLSLCSDSILAVEPPTSPDLPCTRPHKIKSFSSLVNRIFRPKKVQSTSAQAQTFVAEPVGARSCSFVGTHEYVAPEVASGGTHGSSVDWWALGIFLYELIYGRTPFAAPSNEAILRNIIKSPLTFPTVEGSASGLERHARDLISKLLEKNPADRLGSRRGSADIKTHRFFKGLNFALIRTVKPPEIPGLRRLRTLPCKDQGSRKPSAFDYF